MQCFFGNKKCRMSNTRLLALRSHALGWFSQNLPAAWKRCRYAVPVCTITKSTAFQQNNCVTLGPAEQFAITAAAAACTQMTVKDEWQYALLTHGPWWQCQQGWGNYTLTDIRSKQHLVVVWLMYFLSVSAWWLTRVNWDVFTSLHTKVSLCRMKCTL